MIYTTLNKIRDAHPCEEGWTKLLRHLDKTKADDEPLALLTILESNGLDDALWCVRTLPVANGQAIIGELAAAWDAALDAALAAQKQKFIEIIIANGQ